ncbi:hypothetical protein ACEPAG_1177 [Sanghuangporus baumii]
MDLQIQPAKLLSFDQTSSSWIELPPADEINESPDHSSQMLPPFVIATWNIWQDDRFAEYRHPYILRVLFEKGEEGKEEISHYRPSLDVITLQEVTPEFFALLLAHPAARAGWVVTDLAHQLDICPNPYGTVILIRKSLLFVRGYAIAAGFHEFENTRMQRGLSFVELCSNSSPSFSSDLSKCIGAFQKPTGTSHFESHPEDKRKRREQSEVSAEILTSTESFFFNDSSPRANDRSELTSPTEFVPAILTGDYDPTFIDAFLAARPIKELTDCDSESPLSPFTSHPTFGVTLPNRKPFRFGFNFGSNSGKKRNTGRIPEARRLDYIFTHALHPASESLSRCHNLEAGLSGDEQVCEKSEAEDEEGRDGRVFASDHLGVWVRALPQIPGVHRPSVAA